jgi:predicted nucleic acid-binding protein
MAPAWAYFDTSALVKRYINERGSMLITGLMRRHDFLSSAITPVEVMSAFCRRRREGDLSEKNFLAVSRRVQNDRVQWELVEVSSTVLNRAEELIQGIIPIRALDAIQVASLVTFQAASALRIPFVTADERQREAGTQFGLDVIWVG